MALKPSDLFAGESMLFSKNANFRFSAVEALGGRLHVTDLRLVFDTHPVNSVVGRVSVFLPTITKLTDSSRLLAKRLTIVTTSQELELVVWGVPVIITRILAARDALPLDAPDRILAELMAKPGILGDDAEFEPFATLLREPGFDPRGRMLPWPAHTLGRISALNAVSLAIPR